MSATPDNSRLYNLLFDDAPLEELAAASDREPWSAYGVAKEALAAGDKVAAIEALRGLGQHPECGARHRLLVSYRLRALGVRPAAEVAKRVLGAVVEVHLPEGLDVVAAYADRTARYLNHRGGAVVWERPDESLDEKIDALLSVSAQVVRRIGPWEGLRQPPPPPGVVRLSFLTPSGLHFGQGPFQVLAEDPMGGPVIQAATRLMKAMIDLSLGPE